ncbi:Por secretion system C-terminal sorting domain-containing protein [Chryseolinea serpens]|uniref:Por secretion system C-terminal sorting domain-containing protein n=1 Tax=Chryseolinea serpens TaxID=947013 RepID=A0A1M5MIZ2_9BACT|nr:choice-of-anchor V domain-containing protein [Chryseolinea serpens]SHG77082.1 Por secretion system C-terminal sorting domain-containing protein [Chryseolinea serpens]
MKNSLLTVVVVVFIIADLAFTFSTSAPPAANANDPGNDNCTACHTTFPLSTSGVLWNNIHLTSTVPLSQFAPGTNYTLQLSFADALRSKYGFELVALPSGAGPGDPSIGSLTATSPLTVLQTSGGREYLSHSPSGTSAPSNTKTWTFDWETPSNYTGDVDFFIVISSTNGDGTSAGDRTYARIFSSSVVLPITLLSFEATPSEGKVHLKWVTASEENNQFFTVQRTVDAKNFVDLDTVAGAGTTNVARSYEWVDHAPYGGNSYYRIMQTDYDGRFTYSKLVSAKIDLESDLRIYPNPVGRETLTIESADPGSILELVDILKNFTALDLSAAKTDQPSPNKITLSNLASGFYVIQVRVNGVLMSGKVVVQ